MTLKTGEAEQQVLETTYWWGVPTLFRCPHDPDLANCDIGLVGIPHSAGNGTTEHDQHLGPRAVRNVSPAARRVHNKFEPFSLGGVPHQRPGRCALARGQQQRNVHRAHDRIFQEGERGRRAAGVHRRRPRHHRGRAAGIGGARVKLTNDQPVALLHLDAHTDTFEQLDHFLGAKKSAAHWGSYLVRQGHVDATKSVQIGLRGNTRSLDWLQPSYDLGYEVITMDRYREIGAAQCCEIIRERIGDAPVYITFDLDCLDPTIAPAVSNLEAGCQGFSINEAVELVQSVRGLNVVGGDVVCLMPTKDQPNNITAMVAAAVMFEIISLIADRHVAAA